MKSGKTLVECVRGTAKTIGEEVPGMKYRKEPVVIEAVQWDGRNLGEIKEFVGDSLIYEISDAAWKVGKGAPAVHMGIKTLEGTHICSKGDYIIKGVQGEFYPCKPDIFMQTYERVEE